MAVIMKRHFSGGGQQLDSLYAGGGKATMQKILEDIATDLATVGNGATIVAADAAVTAVASAVVTAAADATDDATVWALANDLKAKYNLAVALINDLKAKYNAAVTLINELKTSAGTDGAILTTIQA